MTKRFSITSALMTAFASLLALLLLSSPVFAHHKDSHDKGNAGSTTRDHDGDADSDGNTRYTEDNDTNDGGTMNNVSDEGDNKHPSGKDRSVENGKSGNQGNSESDPDDDGRGPDRSNGGPDKPNGSGGVDLADQDGNNGCGNDDDFEDDNEGWCGRPKPAAEPAATAEVAGGNSAPAAPAKAPCSVGSEDCSPCSLGTAGCTSTMNPGIVVSGEGFADLEDESSVLELDGDTEVKGVLVERAAAPADVDGRVLGVAGAAAPVDETAPSALAATGLGAALLMVLALVGLGTGAGMLRRTRRH